MCVQYSVSWTSSTCVYRNILWPEHNFRGWEHISPSICFRAHPSNQLPASRTNLSFLEQQYHQSFIDVYLNGKSARCFSFSPNRFTIKLSVVCSWFRKVAPPLALFVLCREKGFCTLFGRDVPLEMLLLGGKKCWIYHQLSPLRFIHCKLRILALQTQGIYFLQGIL